jgi:hypothetical protein
MELTERIIKMPSRKPVKWIGIFILYLAAISAALFITRIILKSNLLGGYILNLVIISLGSALIPCIGGFLGKRAFFAIYSAFAVFGIIYMFYLVITDKTSGWGDLASIIGYLFIIGIGTVISLLVETVIAIAKLSKNKGAGSAPPAP